MMERLPAHPGSSATSVTAAQVRSRVVDAVHDDAHVRALVGRSTQEKHQC